MRVTFLGTGSAMPTGERFQTGILLEQGGDKLLVDCGSGTLHGLARTPAGYEGIDAVLLTHHHLDHIADLLPLLKARWLAGSDEVTVAGPPGTTDLVDDMLSVHDYLAEKVAVTTRDVDTTAEFEIAGFSGRGAETRHSMPCLAYRLTPASDVPGPTDPPTVGYSGDTEAFPELIEFFDGTAVLVHDCSFPDGIDVSNHPTPAELGDALAESDAELGRVYLTHLYPHTDGEHDAMLASITDQYDGDVRVAEDGLTLDIG